MPTPSNAASPLHPLSPGQQALWFLDRLSPGHAAYVIAGAGWVRSALDPAVLARALCRLVDRHPALRTTFRAAEPDPVQAVHGEPGFGFTVAETPAPVEAARTFAFQPFDLERGPLLRAGLFHAPDSRETLLALAVHHIVSDFWSLGLMLRDLGAFYEAELAGGEPRLAPLDSTYFDWVERQTARLSGEAGRRLEAEWRQALAEVPLVLEFPTDRPRPAVQTQDGASIPVRLSRALSSEIRRLGRRTGATPAIALLAGFEALLHKITGQPRLLVGMPTTGRRDPRVAGLVGYFVNPVPIAGDFSGAPGFREVLSRIRASAQAAFDRQDFPFARLVQSLQPDPDPSRSPLVQAMFVLQKGRWTAEPGIAALSVGEAGAVLELGPLRLESVPLAAESSQMDLALTLTEVDGELAGRWSFNPRLFERATIRRWAGHLGHLLQEAVAAPDEPLASLPWLTAAERHQLLHDWGSSPAARPAALTLHALLAARAAMCPDRPALCLEDATLSYGELFTRADRLARRLAGLGVRPETAVALCAERSFELIAGMLAVFQAGGVYLPLDPSYPDDRLSFLLADAAPAALLTHSPTRSKARALPGSGLFELPLEQHAEPSPGPAPDGPLPDHQAYRIYTSGSTGRPKGVMISHRAVTTRLCYGVSPQISAGFWFLQKASIGFDASILEIGMPLVTGSTLVILPPGRQKDLAFQQETIRRRQITSASFPPSALAVLVEQGGLRDCPGLLAVACGGEALPAELVSRFFALHGDCTLINFYGPTETTVTVTRWACRPEEQRPSIGRPIGGAAIYLLDRAGEPVPLGVVGELSIGGPVLARGYWQDPGQSAERFLPDPFTAEAGARLYRTGDLGRWRPDGAIDFLGRRDEQVKIRGIRVELGEIEARLDEQPEVQEAAVVLHRAADGDPSLVAFLIFRPGREIPPRELRQRLQLQLPAPMVPAAFRVLEDLPRSAAGKVDRRGLAQQAAEVADRAEAARVPPQTAVELQLAEIWAETLGVPLDRIGIRDDFFELGGHSLRATQVVVRLRESFGIEIPVRRLFEAPTLEMLALAVAEALFAEASPEEREALLASPS